MIHYSCDRCQRVLDPEQDLRYVVNVEVHAAMDRLEVDEDEEDRDHLLEIQELLEHLEDAEDSEGQLLADDVYQRRRFDLCLECFRKYVKNPVGRDVPAHLGFSQN